MNADARLQQIMADPELPRQVRIDIMAGVMMTRDTSLDEKIIKAAYVANGLLPVEALNGEDVVR